MTEVNWHKVTWNKTNCLKMSHCTCFALLNKLLTKGSCAKWTKIAEVKCLLCKNNAESADRLFFDCYTQNTYGL